LDPQYFEAWVNRSVPLNALKRYQEACTSCEKAIALRPNDAQGWLNRGIALNGLQLHQKALHAYDQALTLRKDYAEAHANKGATLQELERLEEAITQYQTVRTLNPEMRWVYGSLLYTQSKICSWDHFDVELQNLSSMIMEGYQAIQPFPILALTDDPALHKVCAQSYGDANYPIQPSLGAIDRHVSNPRVTIAYFSADFHHHATSHLIAELFELHDKSQFRVIGFSFGPESKDAVRERLGNSLDELIDVRSKSDLEIAQLARQMGIDIAIDLKGYTQDSRPGIFAYRAAPIQVSYLGYPGTLGVPYIDYLIADATIIPKEAESYYCEQIVRLPHTYQVNDRQREIASVTMSRSSLGLPETGFVFACFNNNYKILPATFDRWMRILKATPGSILWLFEDNPLAAKNLKIAAEQRGVQSSRLIFAKRESLPVHLARHAYADLFLDTTPYNAHTTASDALWAGLPVLTLMGQSFASRVAASLLNAIGLPELITTTPEQYEARAIELALQPETLIAIKAKLAANRLSTPLFDTPLFTKHLESAYQQMYERY
ncbi:hypothetical protein, partial [Polynucleobacter sp. UK-Kesae-W10]|uniref:O-linked N-acetylglucosamine transferase, SPINDLY family protein n=1 Tax=Polynucleobacter sp. UK-Kesae-W10 TaxID=1819738 RepID=UPI001C0BECA8